MRALVKVNLTLHVGAARADGYHPVSSACVFPDVGDEVELGGRDNEFTLRIDGPEAASLAGEATRDNLVLRAARALAGRVRLVPRRLRLRKTVPVAAGIAGGTADAAAALVLLNREADRPLADAELIALSRVVGADGPVCTAARLAGGGVWLAEGDGDRVRPMGAAPPVAVLLANPRVPVSTPAVFARFDAEGQAGPLAQPAGDPRTERGVLALAGGGRNDLRAAAFALAPAVSALEARVAGLPGCRFARMSGSGGTVFGLFSGAAAAERAAARLSADGLWTAQAPLAAGR